MPILPMSCSSAPRRMRSSDGASKCIARATASATSATRVEWPAVHGDLASMVRASASSVPTLSACSWTNCRCRSPAIALNESPRACSSSPVRTSTRVSNSPRARPAVPSCRRAIGSRSRRIWWRLTSRSTQIVATTTRMTVRTSACAGATASAVRVTTTLVHWASPNCERIGADQ